MTLWCYVCTCWAISKIGPQKQIKVASIILLTPQCNVCKWPLNVMCVHWRPSPREAFRSKWKWLLLICWPLSVMCVNDPLVSGVLSTPATLEGHTPVTLQGHCTPSTLQGHWIKHTLHCRVSDWLHQSEMSSSVSNQSDARRCATWLEGWLGLPEACHASTGACV